MPYSIQTKDGIKVNNIPDNIAPDSDVLKRRVAAIRAGDLQGERESEPSNGVIPSATDSVGTTGDVVEDESLLTQGSRLIQGAGDAAASIATGAAGEVVAGLAGLGNALNPFAAEGSGAETVKNVRQAFQREPATTTGQEQLQAVGETLQPVGEAVKAVEKASGEAVFQATGSPMLAAGAEALPAAVLSALPGGGLVKQSRRATPESLAAQDVIAEGAKRNVPVTTSDVFPPTSGMGKFARSLGEKLGPLGVGPTRVRQQAARKQIAQDLADEFDVSIDSDFAGTMIKSLNKKTAKRMETAHMIRNKAVEELDKFGDVPNNSAKVQIQNEIATQLKKKDKADTTLIKSLEEFDASMAGDFSQLKVIRTEIIDDIKQLQRGEGGSGKDRRAVVALERVKSAIDDDMASFGAANNPKAIDAWKEQSAVMAEELTRTKGTELKRLLLSGEVTPEIVVPILKRGRTSELERLHKSLGNKGRDAAKAAIIHNLMDKAGYFKGDLNPNRLSTALNETNAIKAINVFFKGKAFDEIDGLNRLLSATRQAQDSQALVRTGEQVITGGVAGGGIAGLMTSPLLTATAGSALLTLGKGYESSAFRNLLVSLGKSKPGSKKEGNILRVAVPSVIAAQQASRKEREQTQ